jgi:hypothetical protein
MPSILFARIALVTLAMTATYAYAGDRRPQIIHTDDQTCVYSYYGNETFMECDKSAELMQTKYKKEDSRIDGQERREYDLVVARKADEQSSKASSDAQITKMEAEMVSRNPKGWACVMKKLPRGSSSSDATDRDMEKCAKAFNAR